MEFLVLIDQNKIFQDLTKKFYPEIFRLGQIHFLPLGEDKIRKLLLK